MKNGKNILILVGVAIVAYLLLNYFNKSKASNLNTGTGGGSTSGSGSTGASRPPYTTTSVNVGSIIPVTGAIGGLSSAISEQMFNPNSPNYAGYNYVNQFYKGGVDNGGGYNQWVVDNYYQFPLLPPENRGKSLWYKNKAVIFKGSVHGFPFPTTIWQYEVEPNLEVRKTPDGLLYSLHYALHDGVYRPSSSASDQRLFNTGQRVLLQPNEDGSWNYLRNF